MEVVVDVEAVDVVVKAVVEITVWETYFVEVDDECVVVEIVMKEESMVVTIKEVMYYWYSQMRKPMKLNLYDQTRTQVGKIDVLKKLVAKSSWLSLTDSLDMVLRIRESYFVVAEVGEVEEIANAAFGAVDGMIAVDDTSYQIRMLVQRAMQ